MSLKAAIVPVTQFQQNCSIIWCDETKEAAVVDPGGDLPLIQKAVDEQGVTIKQILLTHAHIDHAGATKALSDKLDVPIIGPQKEDQFWIDSLPSQSEMFGFPKADSFTPTRWLEDGDQVEVGNCTLDVIHAPGHTPGHVVFFHPESKLAIVGDVLFQGSIGRTDFPKGDYETLISSIKDKLWPLGSDVAFIPGHGPMSTFGDERRTNAFVRD
ncbi:MAG: MBL fold metallo-hydrolase [Pseudomonadales bacterium]|nr:MBL fold metallo-hydrolase [Pseudomonadales bacterium]